MDAADPLGGISTPTRLLPRTIGPAAASAASPSKAREVLREAISRAQPLKGSKDLVEHARMVLKGHGDIRMLYQDDGVKAGALAKGMKDQQGRTGLDRKRARPSVDQSDLLKIKNPREFFKKLNDLEEAEKEIRQLNGEVIDMQLNFDPVVEPRKRSTLPGRKSVHTFKLIDDADTQDPVEAPASQTGTMPEFQLLQDDANAPVPERYEQSIPSKSGQCAVSDVSQKEGYASFVEILFCHYLCLDSLDLILLCTDSLPEKDYGDDLTYLLTSLKNLDEPEEEDLLRKTLGIKKIRMDNSIPGVSLRSNPIRKSSMVPPPESPLRQSCQSRIAELEKHLFPGDAANDKYADLQEDDESEGLPDIVMGEQSLGHDSSDVLMIDETLTASVIDKETPDQGAKVDPEPNMPDLTDERQAAGSSLGLYAASEYDEETPNLGVQAAEHVLDPEPIIPDHADERQAEGSLLDLHSDAEAAEEKAEVVEEGNVIQADLINAPSLNKEKKRQAVEKGKKKSKRSKKVADESNHPLETSQANSDSENRPHMDENIETVVTSNTPSPKKAKGQKGAQRRNRTKQLNQRKSFGAMATVIGIKAYSPDQDGKRTLKVKSFVPEQYSDIVAEAAKY
ncbi:hypothetical protein HU200_047521 [Digitaria exilis]|uniref:Uncharacterized protein n=1 Tax=Digitaria exilis TaxID=1010633 RepID=A0A835AZH6_9POAL|nr:hypothetical protein HU200_047521 [Digitaria exilis]